MDYHYQPDAAHRCKRDVLLCRLRSSDDPTWKRVRPRPARNNFLGAFVLCKGMAQCLLKKCGNSVLNRRLGCTLFYNGSGQC